MLQVSVEEESENKAGNHVAKSHSRNDTLFSCTCTISRPPYFRSTLLAACGLKTGCLSSTFETAMPLIPNDMDQPEHIISEVGPLTSRVYYQVFGKIHAQQWDWP